MRLSSSVCRSVEDALDIIAHPSEYGEYGFAEALQYLIDARALHNVDLWIARAASGLIESGECHPYRGGRDD